MNSNLIKITNQILIPVNTDATEKFNSSFQIKEKNASLITLDLFSFLTGGNQASTVPVISHCLFYLGADGIKV